MTKRLIIIQFVIIVLLSVSTSSASDKYISWSLKIAGTIMTRHDSLVKFMDRKESWQYDYALLAGAIGKLSDITGDAKYYNYLKAFVDYYIKPDGTIKYYKPEDYNLDLIRPGVNLFTLYHKTGQKKYEIAIKSEIGQLKTHPRTSDGGFWHKKVYPNQMWLDGIFMACPFMAQYAYDYKEPLWYDEIVKQITQIYSHTLDSKTGLLYHGWDESRQQKWSDPATGTSPNFWSRAMGWYVMAIADVLDYIPENNPGRPKLIKILNDVSAALVKVQDKKTGLWYQVLNMGGREGNYLEASGSAMFVYAFAKGVRKGYLPGSYLKVAEKGFDGICYVLVRKDDDGGFSLTQTCGGCGLGGKPYRDGSYAYYVGEKVNVNDPKGLAPFILAGIELTEATI
jgi:unsaturated rhamnogalacturonyl hydrolase